MHIQLQGLRPDYLDPDSLERSEVWGVELDLPAAGSLILWGPSGQGKSTFLRILYGLEHRFAGTLLLGGEHPPEPPHRFWAGVRTHKLAMVPQSFRLFDEESGWENLGYLPVLASGVDAKTIEGWAAHLEIGTLLDRHPATWSQGQKQRFCLLRALASPFAWILLDEPVSHLDPESAQRSLELLRSVCAERGAGWILAQQTPEVILPSDQILRV